MQLLLLLLLGRVALVKGVAAYSHQTFPWTICRSVRRYVGMSSALWKNGGSDPDAVWHRRSYESRDEAGIGVWQSVPREGALLGTNLVRAIVTNGDFTAYVYDSASTVRAGVVRAVGRSIAVLDGVHVVQGEGQVLGFCSPFSQWEMPLGRRR